ncbi:hypothetical protein [Mumia zhuanghuii]|uniref:Uncharacterized protein n=1 Tax=Mumia zhuanghuii TaxID=2585211 RepID=A0A5C4MD67_9ACTN|nr:hypothetical protein [Mumia zhuanghuii]TNC31277.1 hypothetical protein FHE65_31890 [Mumia zhuanghuii]
MVRSPAKRLTELHEFRADRLGQPLAQQLRDAHRALQPPPLEPAYEAWDSRKDALLDAWAPLDHSAVRT